MSRSLEQLASIDFELAMVASTPRALREMLRRNTTIRELKHSYDAGFLSDVEIQRFVHRLIEQGSCEPRFPHQTALAAVAVLLADRYSSFAEEYIRDLSRVRSGRMIVAARVARIILTERERTKNSFRVFPQVQPITFTCLPLPSSGAGRPDETNDYCDLKVA
ncbi:MAG: hypothetical protein HY718_10010 [Planctomycetes bacterium]|nr:hypothetical protein [Planctomycetota bacterium]